MFALEYDREVGMLKGIYSTMCGKFVSERRMEMISNNLANALTPGYKASKLLVNMVEDNSSPSSPDRMMPTYMNQIESYIHFAEAPLVETKNTLDVALEGNGFFVVSTKEGNMYTRNGKFTLDEDKKLVTLDGSPVLGQNGEITIDARQGGDVKIENDGSIFVDRVLVDRLKVVEFADKKTLRNHGESKFINTDPAAVETTSENVSVKQGFYEASNVNVMNEMVEMMSTVRAYETYTKVDQAFGDMMEKLVNMGR
jgi:flagellar basal-body rod protein FlgF